MSQTKNNFTLFIPPPIEPKLPIALNKTGEAKLKLIYCSLLCFKTVPKICNIVINMRKRNG